MDNPGINQLELALKARLHYVETNGGKYDAVNKDTNAMGKYQFMPKIWMPEIEKFAKQAGYGKVTQKDFVDTPALQEEFFSKIYMPKVYNFVKKQLSNNVRNLDPDEIAQLYHLNPKKATAYVKGGDFEKDSLNPDGKNYLERGSKSMQRLGQEVKDIKIPKVTTSAFLTPEEKKAEVDSYFKTVKEIKDSDMSDGAKALRLKDVKNEYGGKGLSQEINREAFEKTQVEKNDNILFKKLHESIARNGRLVEKKGHKPYFEISLPSDSEGNAVLKEIIKKHPELERDVFKNDNGGSTFNFYNNIKQEKNSGLQNHYLGKYNELTGKQYTSFAMLAHGERGMERLKNMFTENQAIGDKFSEKRDIFKELGDVFNDKRAIELEDVDFNDASSYSDFTIDPSDVSVTEKDYGPSDEKKPEGTNAKLEKTLVPKPSEQLADTAEKAEEENSNAMLSYLDAQYLELPDKMAYDKSNYKPSIPFEAIANGFIGVMGMQQANTDVPLRDEQISQGVLDYASKLAKISQMGLPPEEEARLKDDSAAAYSIMMNNIVEASAGNRNLVLGNQGQLDYNRVLANNEIAIEDFRQKQIAMEKYGDVMSYINEFDSRRDIANTQTKQAMAFDRRQDGRDLAFAGFSSMAESLEQARQNGPGSANHMLMSQIKQNAFGYDPDMKDDGQGTVKGTRSWYEKNVIAPITQNNENIDYLKQQIPSLDQDQSKFFNMVAAKTNDPEQLKSAIDFAKSTDTSNLNKDNINRSINSGNYGSMLYNNIDNDKFVSEKEQGNAYQNNIS